MSNGIIISQSGVSVETAADYKKSLDSRWRVLEVEYYGSVDITVPSILPNSTTQSEQFNQKIILFTHGLGFYPLFEISSELIAGTPSDVQTDSDEYQVVVYADEQCIYFFPFYQWDYGQNQVTFRFNYRIYNLDITNQYIATTGTFLGDSTSDSKFGVRIVDDSGLGNANQDSLLGLSLDTTKKILGIQAVINQAISSYGFTYVKHYAGYPPTYLVCNLPKQIFLNYSSLYNIPFREKYFSSPIYNLLAYTVADEVEIGFHGVQSSIEGNFCFVILKDPVDISA
jgi:hypothetical protein